MLALPLQPLLPTHVPLAWIAAALLALALAARASLTNDPRYEGVDWVLVRDKLRGYVSTCVGRAFDADDIVHTVLMRVLAPDARPWDRQKQSILMYLGSFANTEIWNLRNSADRKRSRFELTEAIVGTRAAEGADPVHALTTNAAETRGEWRFETIRARLAGDTLTRLLLTIYEEAAPDPEESTRRALEAGYTEKELYAARRKIHREVARILEEERRANLEPMMAGVQ